MLKSTPIVWVGADPGGAEAFGLALMFATGEVATHCVSCADEAVELVSLRPSGVGVDAPLWWSSGRSAEREADRWIRRVHKIASGTVQTANSLRGAALVQGTMFVARLREKFPGVPVTEAHPKAVAIALGGWDGEIVSRLVPSRASGEHERDAIFAAVAAREGFEGRWTRDLSLVRTPSEQDPETHWLGQLHYFWPI